MDTALQPWIILSVFLIALLYASVGHGGASGYLALLTLLPCGFSRSQITTTALLLNLAVAGIGTWTLARHGHLSLKRLAPFAAASIPAAFLAGRLQLQSPLYGFLLSVSLALAAFRLVARFPEQPIHRTSAPPVWVALSAGSGIGWISGAIGIGGGVFLSPLLLLTGWETPRKTAALSACFIFLNSAAGLLGRWHAGTLAYGSAAWLALSACAGGLIGARMAAKVIPERLMNGVLACVLLGAALKLLRMAWVAI
jgi:uncharacterized membrane protein YfcA